MIHSTGIKSTDKWISSGINKSGRRVTKRGTVVHTEEVLFLEGTRAGTEDSYKYLGLPWQTGTGNKESQIPPTSKASPEKLAQWQDQDPGNTAGIPAGFIRWPKAYIQTTDVRRPKLNNVYGGSSTLRLCANCKKGGRRQVSMRANVQDETSNAVMLHSHNECDSDVNFASDASL